MQHQDANFTLGIVAECAGLGARPLERNGDVAERSGDRPVAFAAQGGKSGLGKDSTSVV